MTFDRFSQHYIRLRRAAKAFTPGLEYVYFNAHNNFTLQYPLILAPIVAHDDPDTVERKMRLVAGYIDILIARRVWRYRTLGYSAIVYTMFNILKDIRGQSIENLVTILHGKIDQMEESFDDPYPLRMHQQNKHYIHQMLARMTWHVERESGMDSQFRTFIDRDIKKPYEIEHIWADKFGRFRDVFPSQHEFAEYRNHLGGLLLLPRGFNQAFGGKPYADKLDHYVSQNLLARSLHPRCYTLNPSFVGYVHRSGLPFKPHSEFSKDDLDQRQELYRQLAREIWSPARFDRELL